MKNAAFFPTKKDTLKAILATVGGGALAGFVLTGTGMGALAGCFLGPISVAVLGGIYVGGCYVVFSVLPSLRRRFSHRHLKKGVRVQVASRLSPSFCVEASYEETKNRMPEAFGTIVDKEGDTFFVRHDDGSSAAYFYTDLIRVRG